jgi:iron(III) transport system permease protein
VESAAIAPPHRTTFGELGSKLKLAPLPLAVAVVVAVLILPILLIVLLASLHAGTALPFDAVPLTLANFATLLSDPFTYRLLLNTLLYVAASLFVGMAITIPLTWLVHRTDLPFKRAITAFLQMSLVIPPILTTMGWVLLLSPRTGFLNVPLRGLLGQATIGPAASGPLNVYSFAALFLITGVGITPSMYVMLSSAFQNMDSRLEEAGEANGANPVGVARRVTLPLMLPSLGAAAMYYVMLLFETFEVPLVIGPNAKFQVLSIYVFQLVQPSAMAPQYGMAAAFGALMMAASFGLAAIYSRATRKVYKFAVVRGQSQVRRSLRLGPWKLVVLLAVAVYLLLAQILPLLGLLWDSLFTNVTQPSAESLHSASLTTYGLVFVDARWGKALLNTAILVLTASGGSVLLALLVAWVVLRAKVKWLWWLDGLAFIPLAVPGVILALGVFLLLIRTPLYATIWIIMVGHIIRFLPYSVRLMSSTLVQLHPELEEAAQASGAGTLTTFRAVVLPLMAPAVANCGLWVIAHSVRDFTFPLVLGTASNTVVSQLLWETWLRGQQERTSAMAILLMAAVAILILPARSLLTRSEVA